ncbi:conjugal transfer protein TraG N-terminal domain-containing protein [Pseudomonas sp. NPDC047961]
MTLYTTDYLEYFLTLVSWIVSNGIWGTLADTGLFAVPFFVIVVQEWLRARAEGADEGNKGMLSAYRIETRIWVAVVVLIFAVLPLVTVDFSTIEFNTERSKQCQAFVPTGEATKNPEDTAYGASFSTLNGQSAKVPVWWFMMHAVSRAVTSSSIAAIPCGFDLRQMRMEVDTTRVKDPLLAQEVADFTRDCYAPSRAKMFQDRPELSEEQLYDVSWPGSKTFLESGDYYGTFNSTKPRADWPYSESRDEGLARVGSGGGYPTCREWWADENIGLRSRLLGEIEPTLLERFSNWLADRSQEEINDSLIRAVVAPAQQSMTLGQVYADYGGQVGHTLPNATARVASDIGAAAGALAYFPAMDKVRQALPMVLSFIKLAMVVCLPFVLVMGTYSLKTLTTVSMIYFGIFFVEFWLQLARWLDSTIIDTMYGSGAPHSTLNPLMGLNNATGDMVLNYVMAAVFIFLPLFWIGALSWAGFAAGGALQGLQMGTSGVKDAGGKGGGMLMKGVKG